MICRSESKIEKGGQMPKNIYREKLEQMNVNEVAILKKELIESAEIMSALRAENISLKERLRLVQIAARGE
jgi:hypothetical protein